MLSAIIPTALSQCMVIPLGIIFIFGFGDKEEKIKNIAWSVPIPQDLLSRLRDFSPLSISRASGIYLDDVFDILNGTKERTAPEVIDKLYATMEKLQERDMQLDREAAKIAYMIRGFEALEQKEKDKSADNPALPQKKMGTNRIARKTIRLHPED